MGFFSWETGDTNRSICNIYSCRETFTVYMISPDGRTWREDSYEGYGEFGGKDIYDLIEELNGLKSEGERGLAIDMLSQKTNGTLDFAEAAKKGMILPKLSEKPLPYEKLPYPKDCEFQGFFYNEREQDDYDF